MSPRTRSSLVSKRSVVIMFRVIVTLKTYEEQTIHGIITTWAYYERTKVPPEILNFLNNFVAPNMESVDPKN